MKEKNHKKLSITLFLAQIIVTSLIFIAFSAFVWLIQLNYDESTAGYKRAFLFSLIMFGGGYSYDCAKKILFLKQSIFRKFAENLFEVAVQFTAILLLIIASISFVNFGFTLTGQAFYALALGWTILVVNSIIKAVETATSD